jgi:hypothetical protein
MHNGNQKDPELFVYKYHTLFTVTFHKWGTYIDTLYLGAKKKIYIYVCISEAALEMTEEVPHDSNSVSFLLHL